MSERQADADKGKNKKKNQRPEVSYIRRGCLGHFYAAIANLFTNLTVDLEARGEENIPQEGPFLLCANHETFIDALFVFRFLNREQFRRSSVIAGEDLKSQYGVWGKIMLRYGRCLPIDRLHGHSASSIITASKMLQEGNILLIHPEGTRSHDGKLGKIHSGAALIAKRADVPIIPVFIDGGYEYFNRYMKFPRWRDENGQKSRIIVHYGTPILPENYQTTRQLAGALDEWMHEMFKHKVIPRQFGPDGKAIVSD